MFNYYCYPSVTKNDFLRIFKLLLQHIKSCVIITVMLLLVYTRKLVCVYKFTQRMHDLVIGNERKPKFDYVLPKQLR